MNYIYVSIRYYIIIFIGHTCMRVRNMSIYGHHLYFEFMST